MKVRDHEHRWHPHRLQPRRARRGVLFEFASGGVRGLGLVVAVNRGVMTIDLALGSIDLALGFQVSCVSAVPPALTSTTIFTGLSGQVACT